jgi:hypothetical protein
VPLAVAFTSILQVEGLIIALIAASAASTIYSLWIANRKYRLTVNLKVSAKVCFAAFLSAVPVIFLTQCPQLPRIVKLALDALLYMLIYLTATPLLKILGWEEFEILAHVFAKVMVLQPVVQAILAYEIKLMKFLERLKPYKF